MARRQKNHSISRERKRIMHPLETKNHATRRKKSRIWETKQLSTDADSGTDTIVEWTKNTPKQFFFEKQENHQKRKNSKTS